MGRVLKFKAFLGREDIYSVVIASLSGVGCDAYKTGQLQLAKIMNFGPEGPRYDKREGGLSMCDLGYSGHPHLLVCCRGHTVRGFEEPRGVLVG